MPREMTVTQRANSNDAPPTPLRWIGTAAPLDRCLFLDRDGVVNERILDGYVTAWHEFTWRDGAIEALKHLVDAVPLPLVIVTNQSCVGRGLVPVETVVEIQERMRVSLQAAGVPIAAWYCCPHRPEDGCLCRKPLPGMLEACRRDLGVALDRSYLIGDSDSDVQAGKIAGCATWRVDTPRRLSEALNDVIERERMRKSNL